MSTRRRFSWNVPYTNADHSEPLILRLDEVETIPDARAEIGCTTVSGPFGKIHLPPLLYHPPEPAPYETPRESTTTDSEALREYMQTRERSRYRDTRKAIMRARKKEFLRVARDATQHLRLNEQPRRTVAGRHAARRDPAI